MIKNEETVVASLGQNESKILFISGSNSIRSINLQVLNILTETMPLNQRDLIELNNFPMPVYSESEEAKGIPANANKLLQIIDGYNLLVIAVPEHNHAVPAFFKNTIDWLSRTREVYQSLAGKKIILINACPGNGGDHTLINAAEILQVLGAEVLGAVVLKQFYNNTDSSSGKLQLMDRDFLSAFENLLNLNAIKSSLKKTA